MNAEEAVPPPTPLLRALGWLHRFEDGLLALVLGAMVLLAPLQIVLRNFFDSGIAWGDPLLRALVLWVGLLGALAASRGNRQITVDVLSRILHGRAKSAAQAVTATFTSTVCFVIAWYSVTFIQSGLGTNAFASVPSWTIEVIIPISFGLIGVRYVVQTCLHVRDFAAGETAADETAADEPPA
jgi:TRAP-type C4-dicarboxylate transport system permease small subunit